MSGFDIVLLIFGILIVIIALSNLYLAICNFFQLKPAEKIYQSTSEEVRHIYDKKTFTRRHGWLYIGLAVTNGIMSLGFFMNILTLNTVGLLLNLGLTFIVMPKINGSRLDHHYRESEKGMLIFFCIIFGVAIGGYLLAMLFALLGGTFTW